MTAFSDLLAQLTRLDDDYTIAIPDDWRQGRTAFGGIAASLTVAAARRTAPDLPVLRSAQFAFVGPTSGSLLVAPRLLRRGRAVSYVSVDVTSEAGLALRALLCFGAARETRLPAFEDMKPPEVPTPAACPPLATGGAQAPAFLQHFDIRRAGPSRPLAGLSPDLIVWSRHVDAHAADAEGGLIAIADGLPSSPVCLLDTMPPMSTTTWGTELAPRAIAHDLSEWCLVRRRAQIIAEGYVAESVTVWNERGEALMTGSQTVAIFA